MSKSKKEKQKLLSLYPNLYVPILQEIWASILEGSYECWEMPHERTHFWTLRDWKALYKQTFPIA